MWISLGLTQNLFTVSAQELNGGSVKIQLSGLTNDVVKINGTNGETSDTVNVFLKRALDREVCDFLLAEVIRTPINKIKMIYVYE